jgi:hypothetical protein
MYLCVRDIDVALLYEICPHVAVDAAKIAFNICVLHNACEVNAIFLFICFRDKQIVYLTEHETM